MYPEPGQVVRVRSRQYLVEDVAPRPSPEQQTIVSLSCLDDDSQGTPLTVLWETEIDAEVSEIVLLNRTVDRARAVSRRIGGEKVRVVERAQGVEGMDFDLVVNTTRLGLSADDPLPVDLGILSRAGAVMDLVYGLEATPFVRSAQALGIRATDGLEMLVQQGAVSFERWWGRQAPVETMRRALRRVEGL